MSEWISVKDRLPEQLEIVLCYFDFDGMLPKCLTGFRGNDGNWKATSANVNLSMHYPSHWQPLPPPPPRESSFERWWSQFEPYQSDPSLRWIPACSSALRRGHSKVIWDAAVKANQSPDFVP